LNGTNRVSVQSLRHVCEESPAWLFFSTSMLSIRQEPGAVSSNAQQARKGLFQNTISVIMMIGCGSIVGRLSKGLRALELQ
jgi:hypothetical protein